MKIGGAIVTFMNSIEIILLFSYDSMKEITRFSYIGVECTIINPF